MNSTGWIILVGSVVVFWLLRSRGQVSPRLAREYLQHGAQVVDVRSEQEFAAGHLRGAINIPLDRLQTTAPKKLLDPTQVLLLHCHSGMRSAVARRQLVRMGYSAAFNLGSYGRAARILSQ